MCMVVVFCYRVSVEYTDVLLFFFFFFKQKTAYEIPLRLVGSEMCIRDRNQLFLRGFIYRSTGKGTFVAERFDERTDVSGSYSFTKQMLAMNLSLIHI
ncbi:GntR family transcriptional regulator [Lactobacillus casei str. Zhang] [Lacticaseibacillus rhamnosus]|nr:GntR family transcriptional regulator [Lactobacillus casei str. Zhang] [Lacticaseibacillus rhamnosus]